MARRVGLRRCSSKLKHFTCFVMLLVLLMQNNSTANIQERAKSGVSVSNLEIEGIVNVCFTPENSPEQLMRLARSIFTMLTHTEVESWGRIVFHIFGDALDDLEHYVHFDHKYFPGYPKVVVYRYSTAYVLKERQVHSVHQKLKKEEVYVRFYIPQIIDADVEKYLYLDTDTVVLSDVTRLYDRVSLRHWTMAAGVQNTAVCTLGKMLDLSDERIRTFGIKDTDLCMSGGAFFVNKTRWISENRTARWEFWVKQNNEKKLYYLGCMPPQMLVFHMEWKQLTNDIIYDMKRKRCCRVGDFETTPGILHPVKDISNARFLDEAPLQNAELLNPSLKWRV